VQVSFLFTALVPTRDFYNATGNWLFPELSKDYCCIAVDTIGDMGRSCPKDNNPGNGPGTEEETAEWIVQVLKELHIQQPVHVIGYSMGTTLGTCFARFYPEKVGKMILMAPVFLLAPVRILWLAQAISFGLLSQMVSQEGSMAKSLQDWFFGSMVADPKSLANMKHPELRKATESIGTAQVRLRPTFLDVEILTQINQNCPTLVVIGQRENVVDPQAAVAHAQKANLQVIEYENAGHMFFCESPARDDVIERAKEFLST